LTRLAFLMLVVFAASSGLQQQFLDPGINTLWKGFHTVLAYLVSFPTFIIVFTVTASLEYAGRQRGSRSLLGWIFRLPWGDPVFLTQLFAIVVFALGSISGVVSASYDMSLVVRNTTWDAGYFHLIAGTAVTLTFMGITYWLL